MATATLQSLPNEVVDLIFAQDIFADEQPGKASVASYRLCCKATCEQSDPRALSIKASCARSLIGSALMGNARGGLRTLKIAWSSESTAEKHTQQCTDLVHLVVQHRAKFEKVTHLELVGCEGELMSLTGVLPCVMPELTHLKAVDCKLAGRMECMLAINRLTKLRSLECSSTGKRLEVEIPDDWDAYNRQDYMQLSIQNNDVTIEIPNALHVDALKLVDCHVYVRDFTNEMFRNTLFGARVVEIVRASFQYLLDYEIIAERETIPMESLHIENAYDFVKYLIDHPFVLRGVRSAVFHEDEDEDDDRDELCMGVLWAYAAPTLRELTLRGQYFNYDDPYMQQLSQLVSLKWYVTLGTVYRTEYGLLAENMDGMYSLQRLELVVVTSLADDVDFTGEFATWNLDDLHDFDLDDDLDLDDVEDRDFRKNILLICKAMPSLNHLTLSVCNSFGKEGVVYQTLHCGPL